MGVLDDYNVIAKMSNKEAADIIQTVLNNMIEPRGNGKSRRTLTLRMALCKAIKLLEKTPD